MGKGSVFNRAEKYTASQSSEMESSLVTSAYTYNESVEVRPYVNGYVGARFVFDQRLEPRKKYQREDEASSNLHEADKYGLETSGSDSVVHFGLFPRYRR